MWLLFFFCSFYKFQSIKCTERYIVGCKGCALINSRNIHRRNNKWLFERLTRNHLVLLCATWHAATHLVKRERKRAGAGGSGTPDSSTVQRPLRLVCKRSAGRVTNSSGSESGGEGAGRLEWRQRSVVLEHWSPVIFLSGKRDERRRERENVKITTARDPVRFHTCIVQKKTREVQTRFPTVSPGKKKKERLEKFWCNIKIWQADACEGTEMWSHRR